MRCSWLLNCALLTLLFVDWAVTPLSAQTDDNPTRMQKVTELKDALLSGSNTFEQAEELDYFTLNKIDLSKTNSTQLARLPLITRSTAQKIIQLVKRVPTTDFDGLNDSLKLGEEVMNVLRLCSTLPIEEFNRNHFIVRSRTSYKPCEDCSYLGSLPDLFQRLTFWKGNLEANATLSKDAGEVSPAEFASASVHYTFGETELIAGDFLVQSGLGSILWRQFGPKKGSDVIRPTVRYENSLAMYRSTIEYKFFRGLAGRTSFSIGDSSKFSALLFASQIPRAGSVDSATSRVVSLSTDGYVRTETDKAQRSAVKESVGGAIVSADVFGGNWTVTSMYLNYTRPIATQTSSNFVGSSGLLTSISTHYAIEKWNVNSELARSADGKIALQFGSNYQTQTFAMSSAVRHFPFGYHAPFGYMFGESSTASNEQGVYIGLQYRAVKGLEIRGFADVYQTLGATSSFNLPISGSNVFVEGQFKILKKTESTIRLTQESKQMRWTIADSARISPRHDFSVRLDIDHIIHDSLTLKTRIEATKVFSQDGSINQVGGVAFVEVKWRPLDGLKFSSRVAVFSAPSFTSALYLFELKVPNYMISTLAYGEGSRVYFAAQYDLATWLKASTFAGFTSGLKNVVESGRLGVNNSTEFLFQLDMDI